MGGEATSGPGRNGQEGVRVRAREDSIRRAWGIAGGAAMWQQMRGLTVMRVRALSSVHWHARIGTSARTSRVGTRMTGSTCGGFASWVYCPAGQTISILDQLQF